MFPELQSATLIRHGGGASAGPTSRHHRSAVELDFIVFTSAFVRSERALYVYRNHALLLTSHPQRAERRVGDGPRSSRRTPLGL